MKYLSGDVADHDHEVNEAAWVPASEAVGRLAFKSEKAIAQKMLAILEQ
jgi:hypothetical protein